MEWVVGVCFGSVKKSKGVKPHAFAVRYLVDSRLELYRVTCHLPANQKHHKHPPPRLQLNDQGQMWVLRLDQFRNTEILIKSIQDNGS